LLLTVLPSAEEGVRVVSCGGANLSWPRERGPCLAYAPSEQAVCGSTAGKEPGQRR